MALYQGETLTITMVFKDDNGALLSNLSSYTPTVVVYNKLYGSGLLEFQSSAMTIDNAKSTITLTLTEAQTATLLGDTTIEIRLTDSNGSLIGQATKAFTIVKTKINKY